MMDEIASKGSISLEKRTEKADKMLSQVKVRDGWINLSGMDTQIKNTVENCVSKDILIKEIFEKISDAVYKMIMQCTEKTGINKVIAAGGVASSVFVKNSVSEKLKLCGIDVFFRQARTCRATMPQEYHCSEVRRYGTEACKRFTVKQLYKENTSD